MPDTINFPQSNDWMPLTMIIRYEDDRWRTYLETSQRGPWLIAEHAEYRPMLKQLRAAVNYLDFATEALERAEAPSKSRPPRAREGLQG